MEIKGFLSGVAFLLGVQLLLPLSGVKIAIAIPFGMAGTVVAGLLCFVVAYYLFRNV